MSEDVTPKWLEALLKKQKDEQISALSKEKSKIPSKKQKLLTLT